jgi:hypothetical protein
VCLEIWERVRRASRSPDGKIDDDRAQRRFHKVAKRVSARGGQLVPAPGKRTLIEAAVPGRSPERDVFEDPVPGRETQVQ